MAWQWDSKTHPKQKQAVFQEPKPEPSLPVKTVVNRKKKPSKEEPSEPKTGTPRTVPCTNRNRTEPRPPWSRGFRLTRKDTFLGGGVLQNFCVPPIADADRERRSLAIIDRNRSQTLWPQEILQKKLFLVSFDHDHRFRASDRYPIALRGSTQTLTILVRLAMPICAQPTPLDKRHAIARSAFLRSRLLRSRDPMH